MPADLPATIRRRFASRIGENRRLCDEHYLLRLAIEPPAVFPPTRPGQFIQLRCAPADTAAVHPAVLEWQPGQVPRFPETRPAQPRTLLRRPFSLAGRRDRDDGCELEIIYRVVGAGTAWLAEQNPGETTDLLGPLGNGFDLPAEKSHGLLVGGGVGLPPMFYLAEALQLAGWSGCAFVGAMRSSLLPVQWTDQPPDPRGQPAPAIKPFAERGIPSVVTTNDGSAGLKGMITDGLAIYLQQMTDHDRRRTVIFTCGPHAMMQAVDELADRYDVDCQACLEGAMACGMGTCQSCIVRIRDTRRSAPPHGTLADGTAWRYRLTCTDGPVFDARDVIWSED